jgi:predicted SnoaL-like aldol condensation-catalyzing enzyme
MTAPIIYDNTNARQNAILLAEPSRTSMNKPKHERTCDIQKSLETRERFPISHFDSRKYIQHNLSLEDGLGPLLALMDSLPADHTTVTPLRSFEDGDYSVAHLDYVLGDWGPMVGFEVHRWEDDRIVEHWDNLQPAPKALNASGRTMIDGAVDVTDLERTDTNKALVRSFTESVLIRHELGRMSEFHASTALIQHNPNLGDGTDALIAYIAGGQDKFSRPVYRALRLLVGEGNMVLAASEGEIIDASGTAQHTAFYDLYRVEDGVIAEHWDVIERLPPPAQWKNNNGKF